MNKRQAKRLWNVAISTCESGYPLDMQQLLNHQCGTPSCALGNYASRPDLQRLLTIKALGGVFEVIYRSMRRQQDGISIDDPMIRRHFGISVSEAMDLFSINGCGNARNRQDVVRFIKAFLKKKGFTPKQLTK